MDLWFSEFQTKDLITSCRVLRTLHQEVTPFQEIAVLDTAEFGRMLVLDNVIQTTIKDEFVYHEMITHVAMNTHPNPVRVLVIGGGDGGSVREIVKHPGLEKVVACEIDGQVIAAAKEFLPEISSGYAHPKTEIIVDDGIKHVRNNKNTYDVIVVDAPDPVGPAVGLFSQEFYRDLYESLKEDGIFVAQTESPFFFEDLIKRIYKDVSGIFPITRMFLGNVPSYPGGMWTFTMGSKKHDPLKVDTSKIPPMDTKFYSPAIHRSSFVLPPFVKQMIGV